MIMSMYHLDLKFIDFLEKFANFHLDTSAILNSLQKCIKADHKNLAFLTKHNENQHLQLFSDVVCLKSQLNFVKHSKLVY
jgi:hypothetical protein